MKKNQFFQVERSANYRRSHDNSIEEFPFPMKSKTIDTKINMSVSAEKIQKTEMFKNKFNEVSIKEREAEKKMFKTNQEELINIIIEEILKKTAELENQIRIKNSQISSLREKLKNALWMGESLKKKEVGINGYDDLKRENENLRRQFKEVKVEIFSIDIRDYF